MGQANKNRKYPYFNNNKNSRWLQLNIQVSKNNIRPILHFPRPTENLFFIANPPNELLPYNC
jgi:hypothetical protein